MAGGTHVSLTFPGGLVAVKVVLFERQQSAEVAAPHTGTSTTDGLRFVTKKCGRLMMCAFERRCRHFGDSLHSRLTHRDDDAANVLADFMHVTVSSQCVSASTKKLAPARILRSANWSVGEIEGPLIQHTMIEETCCCDVGRELAIVDTQ